MKNVAHEIVSSPGSGTVSADALLMTLTGSLVLLLLVVLALIWAWRRSGLMPRPARQPSSIRVLSTRSLGGRERLVLVETSGRRLLLGVTAGQITCLNAEDKPVTSEEVLTDTVSFSSVMETIRQRCSGDKK